MKLFIIVMLLLNIQLATAEALPEYQLILTNKVESLLETVNQMNSSDTKEELENKFEKLKLQLRNIHYTIRRGSSEEVRLAIYLERKLNEKIITILQQRSREFLSNSDNNDEALEVEQLLKAINARKDNPFSEMSTLVKKNFLSTSLTDKITGKSAKYLFLGAQLFMLASTTYLGFEGIHSKPVLYTNAIGHVGILLIGYKTFALKNYLDLVFRRRIKSWSRPEQLARAVSHRDTKNDVNIVAHYDSKFVELSKKDTFDSSSIEYFFDELSNDNNIDSFNKRLFLEKYLNELQINVTKSKELSQDEKNYKLSRFFSAIEDSVNFQDNLLYKDTLGTSFTNMAYLTFFITYFSMDYSLMTSMWSSLPFYFAGLWAKDRESEYQNASPLKRAGKYLKLQKERFYSRCHSLFK